MQELFTFQQIAEIFYEDGVILKPESPYPNYQGNKREYTLERLHEAENVDDFLRVTVPKIAFDASMDGYSMPSLEATMAALGYVNSEIGAKTGVADYSPPNSFPDMSAPSMVKAGGKRFEIPDLPSSVQELVDELEDCLGRGNKNASALLVRKIIHEGVFIAMKKRGKGDRLKTDSGDDVGLKAALGRCQQECGFSSQVMGRITSAKWIGDSANHSYRVKINEGDLDRAVTGLRLFLQEIL